MTWQMVVGRLLWLLAIALLVAGVILAPLWAVMALSEALSLAVQP